MEFIRPYVEYVPTHGYTPQGLMKDIERVGRICWNSQNKINEDSAYRFIQRLKSMHHYSPFEHGTVYLSIPQFNQRYAEFEWRYRDTHYCNTKYGPDSGVSRNLYITTNMRYILEHTNESDLIYMTAPTLHARRYTFKFTLPISIEREFLRHRVFSFMELSTRYVDMSNMQCCLPYWIKEEDSAYLYNVCSNLEKSYKHLRENHTPQESRDILPLCTATTLYMTGFYEDWLNFIKLRGDKKAHPDAQYLANQLKEILLKDERIPRSN